MSTDTDTTDTERTREEKLKAIVRKDVHPEVTRVAKNLLEEGQEGSL